MARGRARLSGVKKVEENLKRATERIKRAAGAGLYAASADVMEDAKSRTPVDTGTLRDSGYVTLPQIRRGEPVVESGFGGPAEAYAIIQHEDTSLKHEKGEAKFFERAVDAYRSTWEARIGDETGKAFERNRGAVRRRNIPTNPWDT